jgi:hypothetical protein
MVTLFNTGRNDKKFTWPLYVKFWLRTMEIRFKPRRWHDMLRCDDWLIGTDVSEERCVSIFRPDSSSRDQDSVVLQMKALPPTPQKVDYSLQVDMAQYRRRVASSMWILHAKNHLADGNCCSSWHEEEGLSQTLITRSKLPMTLRRLEKRGLKVAVQVIRHCQVHLFRRRYKQPKEGLLTLILLMWRI